MASMEGDVCSSIEEGVKADHLPFLPSSFSSPSPPNHSRSFLSLRLLIHHNPPYLSQLAFSLVPAQPALALLIMAILNADRKLDAVDSAHNCAVMTHVRSLASIVYGQFAAAVDGSEFDVAAHVAQIPSSQPSSPISPSNSNTPPPALSYGSPPRHSPSSTRKRTASGASSPTETRARTTSARKGRRVRRAVPRRARRWARRCQVSDKNSRRI